MRRERVRVQARVQARTVGEGRVERTANAHNHELGADQAERPSIRHGVLNILPLRKWCGGQPLDAEIEMCIVIDGEWR